MVRRRRRAVTAKKRRSGRSNDNKRTGREKVQAKADREAHAVLEYGSRGAPLFSEVSPFDKSSYPSWPHLETDLEEKSFRSTPLFGTRTMVGNFGDISRARAV